MSRRQFSTPAQPRMMVLPAPNLGTLLLAAYRRFEQQLFAGFAAAGHPALKFKHGAVLANLDRWGTRPTDLAVRSGMTKPSMGELIDELEGLGYVERKPDPHDRRAKLVIPTARGSALVELAARLISKMEADYKKRLGAGRYRQLREMLDELAAPGTNPSS